MKTIDLHGLTHDEAVLTAENFVLYESANAPIGVFECKIITGNSVKMQTRIIQEVADKHNFSYRSLPYNPGVLIIFCTFI